MSQSKNLIVLQEELTKEERLSYYEELPFKGVLYARMVARAAHEVMCRLLSRVGSAMLKQMVSLNTRRIN